MRRGHRWVPAAVRLSGRGRVAPARAPYVLTHVQVAAEESKQADDDQVDRNDVVQRPRHDESQNACDERYKRCDARDRWSWCRLRV